MWREILKSFWILVGSKQLFSSEKILDFGIVALSFVCDKYYPIVD